MLFLKIESNLDVKSFSTRCARLEFSQKIKLLQTKKVGIGCMQPLRDQD